MRAIFGWILCTVVVLSLTTSMFRLATRHPGYTPMPSVASAPPRMAVETRTKDPDGFPTPQTAMESLVTECARASGVDPRGTMTAKQVRDTTSCVDLVRAAVARTK